jgi:TatD DNase family protein
VQAFSALLDVLQAAPRSPRGFLLHGYGGPAEMVKTFVDLGAYFSFNIQLEGARFAERRETFRTIPLERLLVETDAPTKPPTPDCNRFPLPPLADGTEVNNPANLVVAYEALAKLRGLSVEVLAAQVEQNFRRLFL